MHLPCLVGDCLCRFILLRQTRQLLSLVDLGWSQSALCPVHPKCCLRIPFFHAQIASMWSCWIEIDASVKRRGRMWGWGYGEFNCGFYPDHLDGNYFRAKKEHQEPLYVDWEVKPWLRVMHTMWPARKIIPFYMDKMCRWTAFPGIGIWTAP